MCNKKNTINEGVGWHMSNKVKNQPSKTSKIEKCTDFQKEKKSKESSVVKKNQNVYDNDSCNTCSSKCNK
jgi:hypothetical protein